RAAPPAGGRSLRIVLGVRQLPRRGHGRGGLYPAAPRPPRPPGRQRPLRAGAPGRPRRAPAPPPPPPPGPPPPPPPPAARAGPPPVVAPPALRAPAVASSAGDRLRREPAGRVRPGMKDRVALVTGGARGIGAATVLALAGAGWSVLAVDSTADDPALPYPMATPADLSGVVRQAAESPGPGRVRSFVGDVRDPNTVTAAVAEAEHRWGGLDAAIAAAGVIAGGAPLWEVPVAQQQAVLDVNLGGVLSLARAAVPALLR